MSYWDTEKQKLVDWPAEPYPEYPAWERIDCGCCAGLEWGGIEPRECKTCSGSGAIARHRTTRVLAHYPGGPLCGRDCA